MKRIFILMTLFLIACSQEIAPEAVTEIPQATPPLIVDATTAPSVDELQPPASLPAGPISMVALGDSLTQGDGDDTGRGYTGRLLEKVNLDRPDSTMTNLGQSGWNSDALINGDQGIDSQLTRAVAELQSAVSQGRAAVAFVWIGSNDLWYLYEYGGDIDEAGDAMDAEHFSSNMDTILKELRGTGAQVIVAMLDDQSKRPVALRGEAFTSITPTELDRMSLQISRYNEIIAEKAAQYGALTVDFSSTDVFTNPATLYDDGNHPNSAGYDVIAQKWYEALSALLN